MSVKLGFNLDLNSAKSSITVRDLDIVEEEIKVLEDLVTSKSKQLEDHVSMLESVSAGIVKMEEEELKRIAEEERLLIERAQSLEAQATSLSNAVLDIDREVTVKEKELEHIVSQSLEKCLVVDKEFASWYHTNSEYFNTQTTYTQARILESDLAEVKKKQQASIRLSKELALKENASSLLGKISITASEPKLSHRERDSWYEQSEALKDEALSLGLYSAKQPGEIVKCLVLIEEALWKSEQAVVKEEIEALIFCMESEESMNEASSVVEEKVSSYREEIKQLEDDAREYNLHSDLLYAWQVLDSIKPVELQEQENERHARRTAFSVEQKSTSVIAHAIAEAQREKNK